MIADHLSRLEKPTEEERRTEIEENFLDEQFFQMLVQVPWYVDIVNYLACEIFLAEFSYQWKRKLSTNVRFYIWDDLLLFRKGADQIIKRCVLAAEQAEILNKCHASPYGGHFAGDKTTRKNLQSGFYWPTLFRDCSE